MRPRFAGRLALAIALALSAIAGFSLHAPHDRTAHAVCASDSQDPSDLVSVSPPANNLTIEGTAPFQVTITMKDTTLRTGPMTMSFSWGDGASTPVNIVSCGDELYNVTGQQLSHTYACSG